MFLSNFFNSSIVISLELIISIYLLICISYCVIFSNVGVYSYVSLLKASTSYSIFVLVISLFFLLNTGSLNIESFSNFLLASSFSSFFQILLFISTIALLLLFRGFYSIRSLFFYEYDLLIIFSLLGLILLSVVNDFTILYIAIELQSLSFYLLATFWRNSEYSNEAGIKYFILGSFSSCILLLGIALIYLSLGCLNFLELSKITIFFSDGFDISYLGLFLILVAFLFKLGAAPFHFWVLDVYEGALVIVTAFFSIVPKAILLCLLLKLLLSVFSSYTWFFSSFFLFSGVLSIVLASIAAIYQRKVKRLLAYSAISHIGFMITAISCYSLDSIKSIIVYIVIYIFTSISIFSIILNSTSNGSMLKYLISWSYFSRWNFTIALTFSLLLFSLAGIPPLSGFYAKMNVLLCLVSSKNLLVSILVVTFSCIGCFYYIRLIKVLFFVKQTRNNFILFNTSRIIDISLVNFAIIVYLVLLYPNLLADISSVISVTFFD